MKMSEKVYRLTVLLLSIILILTILPTAKNYYFCKQQRINNYKNLTIDTKANGNVEVTNIVEEAVLKVKYAKQTDKYTLYLDEVAYDLSTSKYGSDLVVDLVQKDNRNYQGVVIGQCPLVVPLILWTPALIEAAQITIAATISVVGTYTVWYSVDSIAKTIDNNRVETKVQEKEDTKKVTGYYTAALVGGTVVINKQITYTEAVARLVAGMDVFATSKEAAKVATAAATVPNTKYIYHTAHDVGEGFYPHYHPGGRQWVMNKNHQPHCWFGVTN